MKANKPPKPPAHLAAPTAQWWSSVQQDFQLEPHHVRLLTLAGEAWDRCAPARELIEEEGLCIEGREGGMRPHPAIAIERDSRLAFAKLVDQLGLDVDETTRGPGRPPGSFRR